MTVNTKHIKQCILLIIMLLILLFLISINIKISCSKKDDLSGFRLSSNDGNIGITWNELSVFSVKNIEIIITGQDFQQTVTLNPLYALSYKFEEGIHGNQYTISAYLRYRDGTVSETQEKQAIFLDYSLLPKDIPLLQITTENYEEPTMDEAEAPENLWGASIINNEYVDGVMVLTGNGKNISTGINIRIRGNTSSYGEKKPYKIKLDDTIDLINGRKNYADTEWILLASAGMNLKTYIGGYIGVLCGMEWQPRMMFVNVMLNGDWKGCYMLIESVKRSDVRIDISNNGYIFENDAYWWNSGGLFFKTTRQIEQLGFTFKYPNITSSLDAKVVSLQNYMQEIEDRIVEHNSLLWDYLDVDSWVAWIMGRDVMGQGDGGGSNIYYYIYDLSSKNPNDRKVHMGPLWDFDAAYASHSAWSTQHRADYLYFVYLMDTPEFRMAYESKWNDLSQHLLSDIISYLDELYQTQGAGLEQSWELDSTRWQTGRISLSQEIEAAKKFFSTQIAWMDKQISDGLE